MRILCLRLKVRRLREGIVTGMNETNDIRKDDTSEAQLQYHYIEKAREYVKAESMRVGHELTASVITFGCQMNTEPEIMKTRINKGFCKRQPQEAAGVFFL